ncbi:trypsin-like peptidase domain-containing protein [Clostridium subterminale]|uniref:Trypsin-like peptidase domain-containing protein n=1 Tax=Clostridium subterminale TaxID=1550 RepID=A0ABN1KLN6_CLOSU
MNKDINNNELNNNELNNNEVNRDNNLNENTSINSNNNDNNTNENLNYTVIQDVEYTTNDNLNMNEANTSSWQEEEEKKNKKKDKKSKGKGSAKSYIAIALICSILGGAIGTGVTYGAMRSTIQSAVKQGKNNTNTGGSTANVNPISSMNIPEVVAKVSPAVVGVSTTSVSTNVFGFDMGKQEGIGSGFIFSKDGYVLTNYHVVKNASQVKVIFSTGKEVNAKVVNYQEDADLAVVKITDNVEMPGVVELGDSDSLQAGEQVIAIGNPLGKEYLGSVTTGIISAVNRGVALTEGGEKMNLIQTDTAINPGNSGGPLINSQGQVVGINTAKIDASGVEGIGFAIPINDATEKLDTLVKQKVKLGIAVRDITEDLSKQFNLPVGVYIQSVEDFSIAQKGGLQPGDVITKIGKKTVKTVEELNKEKESFKEGDSIPIEFIRKGQTMQATLVVE